MPHASQHHAPAKEYAAAHRQAFHRPRTSLGATGHWIREAGILAPLLISKFVPDPSEKLLYIEAVSIATALLSQGMWTAKIHNERKAAREREVTCHSQG
jgi:hypothetical protein